MLIPSRRTLLLSALLCAASIPVWANPAGQGMTPDDRRQALDRFIAKKKFVKEPFYLVDLDEADRLKYEAWVNQLARSLRKLAPSRQIKPVVLGMFKPVMKKFEATEGEDQDRFLGYLVELMDIFGVESSGGLLSTWRYGHDMTEEIKAREAQLQALNAQALAAMTPYERALLERLHAMTKADAEDTLRSLFGAPVFEGEGSKMWSATTPDSDSTLGLMRHWGSVFLTWTIGELTYFRRL
jgi:Domain of unknown function (DUF4844)